MIPIVGFALTFVWWPSIAIFAGEFPEKQEDQNLPRAEMVHQVNDYFSRIEDEVQRSSFDKRSRQGYDRNECNSHVKCRMEISRGLGRQSGVSIFWT